jgi:hypothetical protein
MKYGVEHGIIGAWNYTKGGADMVRKRDKLGRFQKRADKNSTKIYAFRVTSDEKDMIHLAVKKGLDPRAVVLREAQKVVLDDKAD